ncbi:MAG: MerR family transcriptional regulator [Ramlibacter sp.]
MLTSKDVLERTGISRATLNNYISSGLLPRPEVLPPNPDDGAAPRIGYFPDDTVDRVNDIQRLKGQGWSIARIAAHFAGHPGPVTSAGPMPAPQQPVAAPLVTTVAPVAVPSVNRAASGVSLSLADIPHPAYLLDRGLQLAWINDAARTDAASPLQGLAPGAAPGQVVRRLMAGAADAGNAILHFHLGLIKQRGVVLADVLRGVPASDSPDLESAYRDCAAIPAEPFAQVAVAAPGRPLWLQAAQFREGILFVLAPADQPAAAAEPRRPRPVLVPAPALMPVAVLVTTLQDAHALWLRLPAGEYFELVNEIWSLLDGIFRDLGGRHGSHPGEGMVCHFLPRGNAGYLESALAAAHRTREAMRQLSGRWQSRKGWDVELCMNTGIDAGQDWIGPLRLVEPVELSVLGSAADHASTLSRVARGGAIWLTRGIVDRLGGPDRERLQYGVPRRGTDTNQPRVLASFARLQDLAHGAPVPAAMADLPVTELIDLAVPGPNRHPGQAAA